MKRLFPGVYLLSCLIAAQSFAGSATWNANPISGLWNTAANWTPATVPDGPSDIATFASSSVTNVSISAGIEVNTIVFESGASAFTITNTQAVGLTISGAGIANNSGIGQNFVNSGAGQLYFTNAATAGDSVTYINSASSDGKIEFQGNSSAGSATFRDTGATSGLTTHINFHDQASAGTAVFNNEKSGNGQINFYDTSTADHATITNEPNFASAVAFWNNSTAGSATIVNRGDGSFWGSTYFLDSSNAGESMVTVEGSTAHDAGYAYLIFYGNSSAANGTFIANGGQKSGSAGGHIYLQDFASADNGTFIASPGMVSGAFGGRVIFNSFTAPTAATATLIANGGVGSDGGGILFTGSSLGGQARVQVYGNGFLNIEAHFPGLTIGSLEGDGMVFLGAAGLSTGSNDLSTTFSGVIQGTGGLTKLGPASLTLTGANNYSGTTTIAGGRLVVNNTTGSGTGSGQVQVNNGQLGGIGIIAGAVIVGAGSGAKAILAPGQKKGRPDTLAIQSPLTFNSDGTYQCEVNSKRAAADKVVANGITINGGRFTLRDSRGSVLPQGTVLTVIDNTSANPISGTFSNLSDGATITVGSNTYQVSYSGGDGNDLRLTVVP